MPERNYCPKKGKLCHETKEKAIKGLTRLKSVSAKKNRHFPQVVYRCMYCDYWHIGNEKPNIKKPNW